MSNTTQTRYVRILPSAVESKYGWSEESINTIWKLHKDKVNYYVIVGGKESLAFVSHIEPEHVQEVYVYDEPMVLPASEAQPTTKPMRVKVVKCSQPQYWYSDKVGKEYPVIKETGEDYLVEDDMYSGFMGIEKSDCEVVQPDPEKMSDEQSAFLKRIAELENRVAQLEEQRRSDAKQPEPQPETNLDKARRLSRHGS